MEDKILCPKCGSANVIKRGRQIECRDGKDHKFTTIKCDEQPGTVVISGNTSIVTVSTEEEARNEQDVIRICKIDSSVWEVSKFKVTVTKAYRKDRQVEWDVEDGVVMHGKVRDSGKLLTPNLYHVQVWLKRKVEEIRTTNIISQMMEDLRQVSPKVKPLKYKTNKDGLLYEICIFDAHIGKSTWDEESGENSDLKTQCDRVLDVLNNLLSHTQNYPIEKILIPFGQDWFNVDNKFNTTTKGTPQTEDTFWQKTYREGRILATNLISICSQVAPVDVLVIPGNHDKQRTFMLGDALDVVFSKNPNVNVDNSATNRKYYLYGRNLIGFTHGNEEPIKKLPMIMAVEAPDYWSKSTTREWHTGDKHHKEDLAYNAFEGDGVVVRKLRSISPNDSWHTEKGYVGAVQAAESFLWHRENGLIAQFTATAKSDKIRKVQ